MDVMKELITFTKPIAALMTSWMDLSQVGLPKSSLRIATSSKRLKNDGFLTPDLWLEERQHTDGAEGLWRIHDGLYNFTNFIEQHPGGSEWLILTKGTDISEAFESHHISELPQQMIQKYFVKKAETKRNVPFTFEENGFYRTLKREVRKTFKNTPKPFYSISDLYSDGLLIAMFLTSMLAVRFWSFSLGTAAGILLGLLTTAAHNYIHRRNNFRMYYFQFSLFQVRDWRISHVLSHHLFTNTIIDLEISMVEPFFQFLPGKKYFGGYHSLVIAPLILISGFPAAYIKRLITSPMCNYKNIHIMDSTGLILPLLMYIAGAETVMNTLSMWLFILMVGSFEFAFIGFTAGHHHPDIFHDGDTPRSIEPYDWGLSQLDAVMDRRDVTGSDFLVLTSFGDHCLHHLFPTVDHSSLKYLYPTLEKVMQEFDLNVRIVSQLDAIAGGVQQLTKVDPNPFPPDLQKYKIFSRGEH